MKALDVNITKRNAALNKTPNIAIIGSILDTIIRVAGVYFWLISSDCVRYIGELIEQCADILPKIAHEESCQQNLTKLENVLKH